MEHLFYKLKQYSESDIYPYHMPGHKRRPWGELPAELYGSDITEIDGFDNLHQPEDILQELQDKAARLYGADESFYLINGSTCGILSAISAAVPENGHILMARNCHKSAYHAAYLRNLTVSYLYPSYMPTYDIFDAVTAKQVAEALERESGMHAVLIVSPTYEGRIADVKAIAEVVHKKGIPLIVDEAHGAHLGFADGFAHNSCKQGADFVIHSVHKTLPALTQTALLHVNGSIANREKVKRFLHIYQSSSPSYLLMASIDNALQYVECDGKKAFEEFADRYREMLKELSVCKHFKFLRGDCTEQDVGKLLISVFPVVPQQGIEQCKSITGKQLYDILLNKYHLQLEMASESYALAMFTVNDSEESYRRMTDALLEIDAQMELMYTPPSIVVNAGVSHLLQNAQFLYCEKTDSVVQCHGESTPLTIAWDSPQEIIPIAEAVGRRAAEFVNLYPPGIPILVPGEVITREICEKVTQAYAQGLNVQGIIVKSWDSQEVGNQETGNQKADNHETGNQDADNQETDNKNAGVQQVSSNGGNARRPDHIFIPVICLQN